MRRWGAFSDYMRTPRAGSQRAPSVGCSSVFTTWTDVPEMVASHQASELFIEPPPHSKSEPPGHGRCCGGSSNSAWISADVFSSAHQSFPGFRNTPYLGSTSAKSKRPGTSVEILPGYMYNIKQRPYYGLYMKILCGILRSNTRVFISAKFFAS